MVGTQLLFQRAILYHSFHDPSTTRLLSMCIIYHSFVDRWWDSSVPAIFRSWEARRKTTLAPDNQTTQHGRIVLQENEAASLKRHRSPRSTRAGQRRGHKWKHRSITEAVRKCRSKGAFNKGAKHHTKRNVKHRWIVDEGCSKPRLEAAINRKNKII